MQVYLTGVQIIKNTKKEKKPIISPKKNKKKEKNIKDKENNIEANYDIEEELSTQRNKINLKKVKRRNINNKLFHEGDKKIKNNFISADDKDKDKEKNKIKNNFICERDFSLLRNLSIENKKNNELMANELKEEYLEYIIQKEPKYAGIDEISEDYRKKIYLSYQKYNNNLLVINRKKEEYKTILSEIEKSLINNYFIKDSSMLPIIEQIIEKVKIEIATKQQEYDGYHKIYEELYNKNYTINRTVLDEIDIDRINNTFYDQYRILKSHAILQVSKKQDTLNQIEGYQKKMLEDHDKELKQKNKILKDLKLQIEIFREDEKDLIKKIEKIKVKREQITQNLKEIERKKENIESNIRYYIKRYHKSYIIINKIFKSVNAKNLDDVLQDVSDIKTKFHRLKNNIMNLNVNISILNNEKSKLDKKLTDINKEIIKTKNKNNNILNQHDQKRLIEKKNELKKINEIEYKINENIQSNLGVFHKGMAFIVQKIKLLLSNIQNINNTFSSKLIEIINKYQNMPLNMSFEILDEEFIRKFTFIFLHFSNIIFYLSLRSMSSFINTNTNTNSVNEKNVIIPIYSKQSIKIYQNAKKRALEDYNKRIVLKHEKQKELNIKIKKQILDKRNNAIKRKLEKNTLTQNRIYKRFVDYIYSKDSLSCIENKKEDIKRQSNSNEKSIFFTGIDSLKLSKNKIFENSSLNSFVNDESKQKLIKIQKPIYNKVMSLRKKKDFLLKNRNKFINMFSKYHSSLVRENDKKIYYQKRNLKRNPPTLSQSRTIKQINNIRNHFSISNTHIIKEDNSERIRYTLNLFDENYEYDEDDDDDDEKTKKGKKINKKNETCSEPTFFKLNKDRANIYKKMNDLRKLQMAYFGGRFLNSKANNGMSTTYGGNIFDEFVNNYIKCKNHINSYEGKNNKRKINLGKKIVDQITANQKFNYKMTIILKRSSNRHASLNEKNNKFRKISNIKKMSYSLYNKKTTMSNTKNEKSIRHIMEDNNNNNNKIFSKSSNNGKYVRIKKNLSETHVGNRNEISNYCGKRK